jgi:alkylhydroperoxidase family enzyme
VAQLAGAVPNAVSDADFDELHRHFDDDQIVELVGLISIYGFFNRWNDTFATELEAAPAPFAEKLLADGVRPKGW